MTAFSRHAKSTTALSLIEVDKVSERSIAEGIFGTRFDTKGTTPVERFFDAWNRGDVDAAVAQFAEDGIYEDGTYYTPFEGRQAIQRELLLRQDSTVERVLYIMDELVVSSTKNKVGVKYHLEVNEKILPNSRHCAFYTINTNTGLIESCFDVVEPAQKTGEANLAILNGASKIIGKGDKGVDSDDNSCVAPADSITEEKKNASWWSSVLNGGSPQKKDSSKLSLPEQYFAGESSL